MLAFSRLLHLWMYTFGSTRELSHQGILDICVAHFIKYTFLLCLTSHIKFLLPIKAFWLSAQPSHNILTDELLKSRPDFSRQWGWQNISSAWAVASCAPRGPISGLIQLHIFSQKLDTGLSAPAEGLWMIKVWEVWLTYRLDSERNGPAGTLWSLKGYANSCSQ